MPSWAVGTPGEDNWKVIQAATAELAKRAWVSDHYGAQMAENCNEDGNCPESTCCEFCYQLNGFDLDAERHEEWDGKAVEAGDATWFASGLGAYCTRCDFETCPDSGGHLVEKEIVCDDCMTIADWWIVDPETARDLAEEA